MVNIIHIYIYVERIGSDIKILCERTVKTNTENRERESFGPLKVSQNRYRQRRR